MLHEKEKDSGSPESKGQKSKKKKKYLYLDKFEDYKKQTGIGLDCLAIEIGNLKSDLAIARYWIVGLILVDLVYFVWSLVVS
jgi:hypothetical protein